jgi:hypothetical protein
MARPLQSVAAMAYCTFSGSYYDQAPWIEQVCAADYQVPAGCPIHFVTGAPLTPPEVVTQTVATDGTRTQIANTTMLVGTDARTFSLPDEFSCDCAPEAVTINFQRVAVDVPTANPGDTIEIIAGHVGTTVDIGPPGACPAPDWPTDYEVALACDRCPMDGDYPDDPNNPSDPDGGCAVGGDPSLLLAALGLLPLVRRRLTARRSRP